ncbi:NLE (NUC135) domain-containing protein [Besnoitia besnoiti]|uniref:NLE (NUC135) domain-containing protein n=1 Tax=Besnoitia besnoiti TaxID=94643 RepID=A0A2A9M9W1_BESBE|nr:NLE (NUC135) domain-containing protein [Besnoitia besnoiti]PFH33984.1 NLE (NUC135) domain-containing protein [Besnoitia besnoiti]
MTASFSPSARGREDATMSGESWIAGQGENQEPGLSTENADADSTQDGGTEVQVHFSTGLPEFFQLPDQPFVVPSRFRRLELSKLVNQLLEQQDDPDWPGHQPFDFLVDGKLFLRTSLEEYMRARGITAEVPLNLHYQLAVRILGARQLPRAADWISSLSFIPTENILVEASYDGCCRLHSVSPRSPVALTSSLSPSSPVVTLALNRGPLTASAAFAAGAFLPLHSSQLLLGSSSGALYFLASWASTSGAADGEERRVLDKRAVGIWQAEVQAVGCLDSSVASLGVSTDGVTVAAGDKEGNVYLWENFLLLTHAATQVEKLRARDEEDGERKKKRQAAALSTAGDDGALFAVQEVRPKLRLRAAHTAPVSDLAFAPAPLRCVLYSASLDNSISAWDTLLGGDALVTWPVSRGVTSLACCPVDGRIVCSAHEDGRLRLWDVRSGAGNEEMHASRKASSVLTLDANSRFDLRFAFGSAHQRLCTQVRWLPRQLARKGDDGESEKTEEGEHILASVGQDGLLKLFDVRAPSMPLLTVEVQGGEGEARKPGKPVRLLATAWVGPTRIATGGSDGVTRIHAFGSRWAETDA